jgi:predicted PurR-regulated permease PerM
VAEETDQFEDPREADLVEPATHHLRAIRNRLTIIVVILIAITFYFAKDLFLPVVLGLLIALTFSPVVRALSRLGLPTVLSSVVVIIGLSLSLFSVAYVMSAPVSAWIDDAPSLGRQLEYKLRGLSETVKEVQEVSKAVDDLAETNADASVQKVTIAQPGLLDSAVNTIASAGASAMVALVLALFLLSSNEMFYRKIVATFPRFDDKKRALTTVYDIERKVSRYLFTITIINACLGIAIGSVLYLIGVKDALIWGVLAFLLNYLPFLGMAVGTALVGVLAIVQFDSLTHALLAPAAYFTLNSIEGQLITPTVVGRRLELNTVSVFLTVVFWGWLWGIPGALMAVPFLVLVKVICDNVETLGTLGRFLGSAELTAEEAASDEDKTLATTN